MLFRQRAEELGPLSRWFDTADELHFGTFGGLTTKLVWFAFGLALSSLIPTGAYLWVRRRSQMADGIRKRFETDGDDSRDAASTIRIKIRRSSMVGLLSTGAIYLLAVKATWEALAMQLSEAGPTYGWRAIGAPGAIAVYSSFLLLILAASIIWYRCIWFPPLPTAASNTGSSSLEPNAIASMPEGERNEDRTSILSRQETVACLSC